ARRARGRSRRGAPRPGAGRRNRSGGRSRGGAGRKRVAWGGPPPPSGRPPKKAHRPARLASREFKFASPPRAVHEDRVRVVVRVVLEAVDRRPARVLERISGRVEEDRVLRGRRGADGLVVIARLERLLDP